MTSFKLLLASAVLSAGLIPAGSAPAQSPPARQPSAPSYWTLAAPQVRQGNHTHRFYPGYARPVQTQTYAYGWFGVQPRRHWSKHYGYYGNFTQWSAR